MAPVTTPQKKISGLDLPAAFCAVFADGSASRKPEPAQSVERTTQEKSQLVRVKGIDVVEFKPSSGINVRPVAGFTAFLFFLHNFGKTHEVSIWKMMTGTFPTDCM
jgi:hypothetical protein